MPDDDFLTTPTGASSVVREAVSAWSSAAAVEQSPWPRCGSRPPLSKQASMVFEFREVGRAVKKLPAWTVTNAR